MGGRAERQKCGREWVYIGDGERPKGYRVIRKSVSGYQENRLSAFRPDILMAGG